MSTWSRVKRQVRRNAREVPKARARREATQRAQSRVPLSAIHMATLDRMRGYDARAVGEAMMRGIADGISDGFAVLPDGAKIEFLSVDMGSGGPWHEYERIRKDADDAIRAVLLGRPMYTRTS